MTKDGEVPKKIIQGKIALKKLHTQVVTHAEIVLSNYIPREN